MFGEKTVKAQVLDNTQQSTQLSHVGMIIHSTTLDTESKVKEIYGGNSWSKIEGRFLLGASTDYEVNSTGGTSAITEVPKHSHSIPSLTGYTSYAGNHAHNYTRWARNWWVVNSGSNSGTGANAAEAQDTLTTSYAGNHNHTVTTYASTTGEKGADSVSVLNPYKAVYIWERIS